MQRQYILMDNKGTKIDVLPVVIRRPKLKNFTFLFGEARESIEQLSTAETKALLLILVGMRPQNLFNRQDLAPYYSKQRCTQLLQNLIEKGIIKRLGYGEYLLSPYIALKGSSDLLSKIIANWEGDVISQAAEDKVSAALDRATTIE